MTITAYQPISIKVWISTEFQTSISNNCSMYVISCRIILNNIKNTLNSLALSLNLIIYDFTNKFLFLCDLNSV